MYEAAKVTQIIQPGLLHAFQSYIRLESSKFADILLAVCLQNVAVPLSGDANAVKKYADEMQKIKKQVGLAAWLLQTLPLHMSHFLTAVGWSIGPYRGCRCADGI